MTTPSRRSWFALCLVAGALHAPAATQTAGDLVVDDYHKRRDKALAEAGQRHLQLGSWARDCGLVPQATAQFLRAVEVSQGKNPGARTVLGYMRGLGDAFWQDGRKQPSKSLVAEFGKRAAAIEQKTRRDHLELARRAARAGLTDDEESHYRAVLELGGTLEVDPRGAWRLDGKRVPDELAEWLREQSATDAGGKPVFEAAGKAAPRLANLNVCEDDALQVRTDLPGEAARRLHALGTALFPHLQRRLGGAPTSRLVLTVFARRADYAGYLTARGMAEHAAATGLCDYGTFQTLVSAQEADGRMLADEDLHALVLHELSHLFFYGTAPAVMPDWYAEGFAESFGGQGTFAWDGKTLTVGGPMRRDRVESMQRAPLPLPQLVAVDAAALLASDRERGHDFYAQCWALHRFLLQADCPWRARFLFFEAKCRGQVLGAPQGGQRSPDPVPAGVEFTRLFGADLDALDAAFQAWLRQL